MALPQRCVTDVQDKDGVSLHRGVDSREVRGVQRSLTYPDDTCPGEGDLVIAGVEDQFGVEYATNGPNTVIPRPDQFIVDLVADDAVRIRRFDPNGVLLGTWIETDAQVSGNVNDGWTIVDDGGDVIIIPGPEAQPDIEDQFGNAYGRDGDGNWIIPRPNTTQISQGPDGELVVTIVDPNGLVLVTYSETDAEITENVDGSLTIVDDSGDVFNVPAPAAGSLIENSAGTLYPTAPNGNQVIDVPPAITPGTLVFFQDADQIPVDNVANDGLEFSECFDLSGGIIDLADPISAVDQVLGFQTLGAFSGAAVDAIVGTELINIGGSLTNNTDKTMVYVVTWRSGNVSIRMGSPLTDHWLVQCRMEMNGSDVLGGLAPNNLIQPQTSGPFFRINFSSQTITRGVIVPPGGSFNATTTVDFLPAVYTPDAQNILNVQRYQISAFGFPI